jgi:very-short-patch-repair endonuclease
VGRKVDNSRPRFGPAPLDQAIAALARRQHGVVSREQLRELGVQPRALSHRLAAGRLHQVHVGVYAVGHPVLGRSGRWMAAVLACGPGAALSHASAAALWGLRRGEPTILDMAAILSRSRLEHLLDQAEIRELTDYPALDAIASAHPGHRGARRLRATLATYYAGSDLDRSDLEILFAELCASAGLPRPRINQPIAGKEADFLFPDHRLIVETDSWRYHKTRRAFEDDRARDVLTTRAGYRTLRFTDRQLTTQPNAVANAIAAVLADRRAA